MRTPLFTTYAVERKDRWSFGDKPNPFVVFERESKKHGTTCKARRDTGRDYTEIVRAMYLSPEDAYNALRARMVQNIATLEVNLAEAKRELAELPEFAQLERVAVPFTQPA